MGRLWGQITVSTLLGCSQGSTSHLSETAGPLWAGPHPCGSLGESILPLWVILTCRSAGGGDSFQGTLVEGGCWELVALADGVQEGAGALW